MKIIKRNGSEVEFDIVKITAAVGKANAVVEVDQRLTSDQIELIASNVEKDCMSMRRAGYG